MLHSDELAEPLSILPPVEFACAYGSGVFPQLDDAKRPALDKPMVDYILAVSSPTKWHTKNMEENPHHYSSWLATFGGQRVSFVADKVGVGVHFNPFVRWKDKTIKYGVIGMEKLKEDILTWKALYISGRLQKPTSILVDAEGVGGLNQTNLDAAVYAAMLLSPPEFSEEELYMNICGLSYLGDIRMLFAEDKHKVRKIVAGSGHRFQMLYRGALLRAAESGLLDRQSSFSNNLQGKLVQGCDISRVTRLVSALPETVLQRLASQTGITYEGLHSGRLVAEAVAHSKGGHVKLLRKAIGGIVRGSSFRQMVSGIFAAGGVNAVQYVARKASKAWKSRL